MRNVQAARLSVQSQSTGQAQPTQRHLTERLQGIGVASEESSGAELRHVDAMHEGIVHQPAGRRLQVDLLHYTTPLAIKHNQPLAVGIAREQTSRRDGEPQRSPQPLSDHSGSLRPGA